MKKYLGENPKLADEIKAQLSSNPYVGMSSRYIKSSRQNRKKILKSTIETGEELKTQLGDFILKEIKILI